MPLSGEATKVASGVDAVEVDASGTVAQMFQGLGPVSENGRFAGIADLLKTASQSPGVDELVSLDVLLRLIEQPEYDSVILDTAPTGHTLRLLALPELMDRYLGRADEAAGSNYPLRQERKKTISSFKRISFRRIRRRADRSKG